MLEPEYANEEFEALTIQLILERLGLEPGHTVDASYKKIFLFEQQNPSMRSQIEEAIDHGCKEAMFRWSRL